MTCDKHPDEVVLSNGTCPSCEEEEAYEEQRNEHEPHQEMVAEAPHR